MNILANIISLTVIFAVPLLLGNLFQQLYNTVAAVWSSPPLIRADSVRLIRRSPCCLPF